MIGMENTAGKGFPENPGAEIILASQSPRRQELLGFLFPRFTVRVSEADETLPEGIAPDEAVRTLALRKARAVAPEAPGAFVIGADTVVAIDGLILGKPRDEADAAGMLRRLSGRTHQVYTGVALLGGGREECFHECTGVTFAPLTDGEIAWYLSTGEPFDKAGSYGIQGYGARFIERISGDYFTVMGLPLHGIYTRIGRFYKSFGAKLPNY
ncbi:septum formation protein Maf [Anaerotruncus massiliensis (ex Liu et al. 2021)]|uniref:dTTP/UTP pyrophosphatase n=3 Tax=Oscillospiraceae TaxID=216572 RepID=A0A498CJC3_9FIRM|nr:septum formation protein Maf [Anaerotruncus massiliensis (ex Togo et al. 2019)]RLL08091.1 septum formation protein Maf [Anaerotruncus massiliensis (ex Liu et al. 2021)]